MGEWLINYSGGFVRRGLLGEAVLLVHQLTGLPLLGLASALQIAVYLLFYLSLLPLLRGVRWSLPLLAMLLSPATLSFTVLDPPSSVRKESLLFLALSILVYAVLYRRPREWQICSVLTVLAPALVLTHEALLAFLPWLGAPLLMTGKNLRQSFQLLLPPAVATALAFALVLGHPGNPRQVKAICYSIDGSFSPRPGGLCTGAIAYLHFTPLQAHADDMQAMRFYRYGRRYPLPLILTFLPASFLLRDRLRRGERRATYILLSTGILAALSSIPLFFFARDWGRWIGIHATCLLLLLLLIEREEQPAQPSPDPLARLDGRRLSLAKAQPGRAGVLLTLTLYATCWTLPAVGNFPGKYGYFDLMRYLRGYHAHPHLTPVVPSIPALPAS